MDSVASGNEQGEAQIKSADFFSVDQHPTAIFTSTAVSAEGDHYSVDDEFSPKGVTKPMNSSSTGSTREWLGARLQALKPQSY